MKKPEMKMLRVSSIKESPYNPDGRTDPNRPGFKKLRASIKEYGILVPLIVVRHGRGYELAEGNCRHTIAKLDNIKVVPAVIVDTARSAPLFAELNDTTSVHTSVEDLGKYLKDRDSVKEWARQRFDLMKETLGSTLCRKLVDNRMSYATYLQAKRLARYCDRSGDLVVRNFVHWLVDYKQTRAARTAMELKYAPAVILQAMSSNRPLV